MLYADEMAAIEDAAVGDIVYFGSYEQDNDAVNGTEPVEWYVLDKADAVHRLPNIFLHLLQLHMPLGLHTREKWSTNLSHKRNFKGKPSSNKLNVFKG